MATGMNYDFLYQPSSSSIHQPHVPGSDPSLATEIMPAPPPLSGFPRVNDKGQMLTRTGKVSHKKRPQGLGTVVTLSPRIARGQQQPVAPAALPAIPINVDPVPKEDAPQEPQHFAAELSENTVARKKARLSRHPSIPRSLSTRASSRQLRNSPITADGNSVSPEGVASSQRAATAPITDRETSATALASSGTPPPGLSQPKRVRGKKSHGFASPNPTPFTPRSASLATRDMQPGPNSTVGVKSEPNDDPFISHMDPPLEPLDPHIIGMDEMHMGIESAPTTKIALSGRRKGKGKDHVTEVGGDHEADGAQSNNVTCEGCSLQGGHLVFCDGCPRSFHLLCLNPPLDELKEETWYCQTCTAKRNGLKPPHPKFKLETSTKRVNIHSLFDDLMYNLACEPPKVFGLPEDIRTHFKDVTMSNTGTYMDSGDVVRERLSRHGFVEERDPYRLRDRHGSLVLCFKCGLSAASSTMDDGARATGDFSIRGRPIISCDYCRLHWHMDCLDPPLAVLPVNGRRWMCPNHSAHSMPKIRIPKSGGRVVTITKPGQRNNGNIEVIMDSEPIQLNPQVMRTAYEEVRINGQRYRVPEEAIVLDFWNKAKRNRMREVPWPSTLAPATAPPPAMRPTTPVKSSQGVLTPSSSPLTSLSSLSDLEDEVSGDPGDRSDQNMNDLAAAELLHAFHVKAKSASSSNSVADETLHTEHSAYTRNSSPLSSILSDDPQEYSGTASPPFRGGANSSLSPNPPVSQPARVPPNGIKIIPKAGSFAIRIPASKAGPRAAIRASTPAKQHQSSPPRSEPAPSRAVNPSPRPMSVDMVDRTGSTLNSTKASPQDDELSPAEIAKLKKIKELILAKGEDEVMKFLCS